jgi:heterotetrameric sarcosine oxidase gamma subunit
MCTRTIIGKAEAVLWRKAAAEYHLEVWRSFAGYVVDWLREAGGSINRK